uniref:Uncharacterized protein n=1 Tax=viral metagenome TaxID=1070528 RepID=A0A6C0C3T3_9ZZZZ
MFVSSPTGVQKMKKIHTEGVSIFEKKNADYYDSFVNYGPLGVIIRTSNSLSSAMQNGVRDTKSVRDVLFDLHNYSAMAIMLLDEKGKHSTRVEQVKQIDAIPQQYLRK